MGENRLGYIIFVENQFNSLLIRDDNGADMT